MFRHLIILVPFLLYFSKNAFKSPWCLLKQPNIYFLGWLATPLLHLIILYHIFQFHTLWISFMLYVYTVFPLCFIALFRSFSLLLQLIKLNILWIHFSIVYLLCSSICISHILLISHSLYLFKVQCHFNIWITNFSDYNLCIYSQFCLIYDGFSPAYGP